jgi:inorganic pyrophosphatase
VRLVVDRPLGSAHPREPDIVYAVNYGYVPGMLAPDGHPLDAYILGADRPLTECAGEVIAVVRRRDDVEDKLVVAVAGDWDAASIAAAVSFQEQFFDSWIEMPVR